MLRLVPVLLLGFLSLGVVNGSDCTIESNGWHAKETRVPEIEGAAGAELKIGEQVKTMEATNFYYRGRIANSRFGRIVYKNFRRGAEFFLKLNQSMTKALGDLGMDFLVKDSRGFYNKRHQVPVHSMVLPMDGEYYRAMNKSTQAYSQLSRRFLQIYKSAYREGMSPQEMARKIGLGESYPKEIEGDLVKDMQTLLDLVNGSIYQLPGLKGEQFGEYPYLAGTIGFDAVLRNMNEVEGIFFEPNKGTPSGISNLTMELEILKRLDPVQFKEISTYMAKNDTFVKFRQAIESGAEAWTGQKDGISVIIGPGESNGAHPDIASISLLTGMPMCKPGDLYRGNGGFIYLNVGKGEGNPKVTGIYSRMEESFILQEGSRLEQGASPLVQTFVDNIKVGKELGIEGLKSGVWYEYIYEGGDITKPIVGIARNPDGSPKITTSFSRVIGPSPEGEASGTLREAIENKKVFLNNLGGRLLDNKQAFTILHRMARAREIAAGRGDLAVAGPPPTLPRAKWREEFLKNPDQDKWVVKVDDGSGGDGVYIFANMTRDKRMEVAKEIEDVLAGRSPKGYEIQYFTTSASQTTVRVNENGEPIFTNRVVDLRIFPFFFADGRVESGPTGALVRTAPQYDAKANTSAGGGYGILAVLEKFQTFTSEAEVLPPPPRQQFLSAGSQRDLVSFSRSLRTLASELNSGKSDFDAEYLKTFALEGKKVMHVIGWDYSVIRVRAEQLAQNEISFDTFKSDVLKAYQAFEAEARQPTGFHSEGASLLISSAQN